MLRLLSEFSLLDHFVKKAEVGATLLRLLFVLLSIRNSRYLWILWGHQARKAFAKQHEKLVCVPQIWHIFRGGHPANIVPNQLTLTTKFLRQM